MAEAIDQWSILEIKLPNGSFKVFVGITGFEPVTSTPPAGGWHSKPTDWQY